MTRSRFGNWDDEAHGGHAIILNRLDIRSRRRKKKSGSRHCARNSSRRGTSRFIQALDDKILADWNGLMIAALVHAATIFREPEWIALAGAGL